METRGALLWEPGTNSGWSVEEIQIDPPKEREVLVKLAASGVCHSDQHLDDGVIPLPSAPVLGGHEGAGVVTEIGPGVTEVAVGDHVVLSFLPSCGKCQMCVSGRSNMCVLGAGVLAGKAPDGTHRVHARGQGVGCMSYLGTFSQYVCAPIDAAVKIDHDIPLDKAALIGCGVPTGWGSAVHAAAVEPGDTIAIYGIGGIGINSVQGAALAGARNVVAIDPVAMKRETAEQLGATHSCATAGEAAMLIHELTRGVMADKAIITTGTVSTEVVTDAFNTIRKGGTVVVTGLGDLVSNNIQINSSLLTLMEKRLQGRPIVNIAVALLDHGAGGSARPGGDTL